MTLTGAEYRGGELLDQRAQALGHLGHQGHDAVLGQREVALGHAVQDVRYVLHGVGQLEGGGGTRVTLTSREVGLGGRPWCL